MQAAKMLLKRLASPVIAAYGLKGLNAATAFIATVILARTAGPAVVGDYGFAVLTATLLGLIAIRGRDYVSLRQIAGDLRTGDTASARGTMDWSVRTGVVSTLVVTLGFAAAVAAGPLAKQLQVDKAALTAAALGIGSVAFYRLGLCIVRGTGRPIAGQFFEGFNSIIFAIIVFFFWWQTLSITALDAVVLFFVCQLISVLVMWLLIRRDTLDWAPASPPDTRALSRDGLPIMAVQGTHMFSDWLLLALIAGAASIAEVGSMRVAMQVVMIIAMIVSTGESYIAALVAGDIRAGLPDLVWARHRRATLAMAVFIGPIIAACVIFPEQLLTLAFGSDFAVAAPALAIMSIGQASKILTGPIGGLLAMAGLERQLLVITLIGLALLLVLSLTLVPLWGIAGAATAHAATMTFRNIASYLVARRQIRAS